MRLLFALVWMKGHLCMKDLVFSTHCLGWGAGYLLSLAWGPQARKAWEGQDGVSSNLSLQDPGTSLADHPGVGLGFMFLKDTAQEVQTAAGDSLVWSEKQLISRNKHTFCWRKKPHRVNTHFITNVFKILEKYVCREGAWGLLFNNFYLYAFVRNSLNVNKDWGCFFFVCTMKKS